MEKKSFIFGALLMALGAFILADNLNLIPFYWEDILDFGYLWPWLMIAGGAFFWFGWLGNRREIGLLMPGSILPVYGGIFWYCVQYGWWNMEDLWPFFMIGPGLGFLMMYLLGKRDTGLLVPAAILLALGLAFWAGWNNISMLWPLILIAIGVRLILKHRHKRKEAID